MKNAFLELLTALRKEWTPCRGLSHSQGFAEPVVWSPGASPSQAPREVPMEWAQRLVRDRKLNREDEGAVASYKPHKIPICTS